MNKSIVKRYKALMPNNSPRYVRCYDLGNDSSADRYTVCFTGNYRSHGNHFQYLAMSGEPFHPQGVGQHGSNEDRIDVNKSGFAPAMGRKCHLGKRIPFSELPVDCQRLVMQDYRAIWYLPTPHQMLKVKLNPARFSAMSPKMAAIVGYIVGEAWTSPAMHSLCVTSDGFVISGDKFLGAKSDLVNNWNSLLTAAELAMDEKIAADSLFTQQVMQF